MLLAMPVRYMQYSDARVGRVTQLLAMLVRYVVQTHEVVAELGIGLLQTLVLQIAPVLDPAGWDAVLKALSLASSADALSAIINPRNARYVRS